jgi:hypothetical protein
LEIRFSRTTSQPPAIPFPSVRAPFRRRAFICSAAAPTPNDHATEKLDCPEIISPKQKLNHCAWSVRDARAAGALLSVPLDWAAPAVFV